MEVKEVDQVEEARQRKAMKDTLKAHLDGKAAPTEIDEAALEHDDEDEAAGPSVSGPVYKGISLKKVRPLQFVAM